MTLRDLLKRFRPGVSTPVAARDRGRPRRRRAVRPARPATRLRYGLARLVPALRELHRRSRSEPPAADTRFLLHARLLAGGSAGRRVERRLPGLRGLRPRAPARIPPRDAVLREGALRVALRSFARESRDLLLGQRPVQPLGCLALLLPHPPLPAAAPRRGRRRPFDQARGPGDSRERQPGASSASIRMRPSGWARSRARSRSSRSPFRRRRTRSSSSLAPSDILFIDGSHISKTGSDVNHLFLRILPRLPKGVVVHIHDICLPFEYPKAWSEDVLCYWNEQYVLAALLANAARYEILLGVYFLQKTDTGGAPAVPARDRRSLPGRRQPVAARPGVSGLEAGSEPPSGGAGGLRQRFSSLRRAPCFRRKRVVRRAPGRRGRRTAPGSRAPRGWDSSRPREPRRSGGRTHSLQAGCTRPVADVLAHGLQQRAVPGGADPVGVPAKSPRSS